MKTRNAGLCDVFSDVAVVLFAGGGGRHNALDKPASFGAVRAKAPFAPLDCRTRGPFCRVVCRLDAGNAHKGPQVFGVFEDPFARAFHFLMATLRPFAQKPFDVCAQPPHVLPERAALQRFAFQACSEYFYDATNGTSGRNVPATPHRSRQLFRDIR